MHPARRILLVEDDPDEGRRAREALADSGYLVSLASSLQGARQAVAGGDGFDLVFMDFQLPDGDGLHLIPLLRRAGVSAPVVLLTGNRSERLGEQAFRAGCADLAIKEPNYHLWLPRMAEALIRPAAGGPDPAWGAHVLGVCCGRLQGQDVRAEPTDLWAPFAGALEAATALAVRGMRATGQSLLGSVPIVHLQLQADRHILYVVRGGVFAAAVLSAPPSPEDQATLLAEAAAYGQARHDGDAAGA